MMMSTEGTITTCGNCGKGEESAGELKACMACQMVKYCNRDCQIAHRPQHKKACKKRAAEIHDEALFKEHPPREDCPICFLPLGLDPRESAFKSCCGKVICLGCIYAMDEEAHGRGKIGLCAFCRKPQSTSAEEDIKRMKKLMEADNALAFYNFAGFYDMGTMGMPQDFLKANEFLLKAGELGCHQAYHNLGNYYRYGRNVEVDKKKATHYLELAAMSGSAAARHNLGYMEVEARNHHRAYKHFILSAKAGYKISLDSVKIGFNEGSITKDEYANTLRAFQQRQNEMKSDMRDKAAHIRAMLAEE